MVEFCQCDVGSSKIPQHDESKSTPIKDNINYRRHKGACPFYRENWSCESDADATGGQLLYQIICLMDTPPVTPDEQQKCLHSPTCCWRLAEARRNGRNGHHAEAQQDSTDEEVEDAAPA